MRDQAHPVAVEARASTAGLRWIGRLIGHAPLAYVNEQITAAGAAFASLECDQAVKERRARLAMEQRAVGHAE